MYPLSLGVALLAAMYLAIRGEWLWVVAVAVFAALNGLQFAFAKWWIRTSEDNDVREWLSANPDDEGQHAD